MYSIDNHFAILQAIWPYSGHYHPTEENFREFISFLEENHVDLSNVKVCISSFCVFWTYYPCTTLQHELLSECILRASTMNFLNTSNKLKKVT